MPRVTLDLQDPENLRAVNGQWRVARDWCPESPTKAWCPS